MSKEVGEAIKSTIKVFKNNPEWIIKIILTLTLFYIASHLPIISVTDFISIAMFLLVYLFVVLVLNWKIKHKPLK